MDLGEKCDGGVEVGKMIGKVGLLIALVAATLWPCTFFYPTVSVGSDFRVKVEDRGRPVKGLRLVLTPSGNLSARTGPDGIASFQAIPPGNYGLKAPVDMNLPSTISLNVSANRTAGEVVPFKWPSLASIPVRALRGTIRGPIFNPRGPQPNATIDLMEALSGKVLRSFQTTGWGQFDVPDVTAGLYFLVLKSFDPPIAGPISGAIAIDVNPSASADRVAIDVGWTSCGLFYRNSADCFRATLRVARIAGRVVDSTGGSIGNAGVLIYDSSEKLIEELTADNAGNFSATLARQGRYEIVAHQQGFTPLRTSVQLDPTGVAGILSALMLELGVMGACGAAGVR